MSFVCMHAYVPSHGLVCCQLHLCAAPRAAAAAAAGYALYGFLTMAMDSTAALLIALLDLHIVPPFDRPWRSLSLAEFWGRCGRRWLLLGGSMSVSVRLLSHYLFAVISFCSCSECLWRSLSLAELSSSAAGSGSGFCLWFCSAVVVWCC
jgi:hypothetical protein